MKKKNLTLLTYAMLMLALSFLVFRIAGPHMGERPLWLKGMFSAIVGAYLAYQPIRFGAIVRKTKGR